jgi:hypothetical protein
MAPNSSALFRAPGGLSLIKSRRRRRVEYRGSGLDLELRE